MNLFKLGIPRNPYLNYDKRFVKAVCLRITYQLISNCIRNLKSASLNSCIINTTDYGCFLDQTDQIALGFNPKSDNIIGCDPIGVRSVSEPISIFYKHLRGFQ